MSPWLLASKVIETPAVQNGSFAVRAATRDRTTDSAKGVPISRVSGRLKLLTTLNLTQKHLKGWAELQN